MKKVIKKAATKKISEYGGMEKYASKKAEMKHEKAEGKKVEKKEKMSFAKKTATKKAVGKSTKKPFIYGN